MSTCNTRLRCAQEGQTVIVYGGRESLSIVTLAAGQQFSNKHGHFKHEQFIGAPFGSKVCVFFSISFFNLLSHLSTIHFISFLFQIYALKAMRSGAEPGWVVLLEITPSLYPLACSHRTEILYHADIGYVVHRLGIRPGSVVFEAGTGSGALSVAFAFALQPHGHLYTFEYHQLRANAARSLSSEAFSLSLSLSLSLS
jgi:tRNA (adenine57-N1/adenine58-N1)-methyltransferase